MKAVVWRGDRTLEIETVEDARLEALTDVGLICTSTKGAWEKSMAW